jgi:type I restriction enzyme S subunit
MTIPSGWTQTSVGELAASFRSGDAFLKLEYTIDGIPVLAKGDIKPFGRLEHSERRFLETSLAESRGYKLTEPDDLLVTTRDLTQKADVLGLASPVPQDQPYLVNQGANVLRLKNPELNRYLVYWTNGPTYRDFMKANFVGSTQIHIRHGDVLRAPVWLPPDRERSAIVELLGSLDDKIEQNRRTGRALEKLARAMFKAWFVDFEPVKAKAANATCFPGMSPAAFAALPDRLIDSPIGPVPEGWEVRTLEEVAESVKGLSYKGAGLVPSDAEDQAGSLPLHNLNSVYEGGGYKNEGIKLYRGEYKDRHVIYPGDLIVANTEQGHEYRLIGFPAIVPKRYGERGLFSHHLFRVRPLPKSPLGVQFLYYAIMSARIRDEIVGCTNGTTVNMLSIDGLKRPHLCVPNRESAIEFEQRAWKMYELSESLLDESSKLAALRDYLLPRLLGGRVRVRQAEAEVQA